MLSSIQALPAKVKTHIAPATSRASQSADDMEDPISWIPGGHSESRALHTRHSKSSHKRTSESSTSIEGDAKRGTLKEAR